MRGSAGVVRLLTAAIGGLTMLGGLAALTQDGAPAAAGFWLVLVGLALIIAAVFERWRYRSETAERAGLPIGPGGGEPTGEPLEGRFQRTGETFIDPTSGRRMRVWLDSNAGERRYRAED